MKLIKVYIDTCILKFSATSLNRLIPRNQTINWGGINHECIVHDFREINPNDKINNLRQKKDADSLPEIAKMAKDGLIEIVMQDEIIFESWGLPKMDSQSGMFYGAPVSMVDAPFVYGRIVVGFGSSAKELQEKFLLNLNQKRFLQLQKATGAYQGKNPKNINQLLDAFHIWCAEHNQCDHFLTMDYKLIKVIKSLKNNIPTVKVLSPSELLEEIKGQM
ncbi:hypothetical protein [Pseudodesulfovibrio portus]|uniref:PIN domain-containing protein n=1 Tax=Pseudodesulfovibrio portus TaxID=231439 RepID=A0ABN6RYR7_9BACT|nr:hypothetical protein [Pseudodesulfovibrio portus]BDQ34903.1 hypothetical protein JCM14722_24450 [Pseudodesulfovibrio portus]